MAVQRVRFFERHWAIAGEEKQGMVESGAHAVDGYRRGGFGRQADLSGSLVREFFHDTDAYVLTVNPRLAMLFDDG
ncbi:hypothetical protein [Methylocaldum szegediense]|jgi:hypothetical protein|uniref:hypothetical protein n=1 Tax=Methylocaldum szegediense TaxID=73780 RepID=UPI0003F6E87A|nr:hypothetical protein [Methylocaldum szegediense]